MRGEDETRSRSGERWKTFCFDEVGSDQTLILLEIVVTIVQLQ